MQPTWLAVASAAVRAARKACGLALVLAAVATAAYAGMPPPPAGAPELDPGSVAGGLALLTGGVLMLMDRRKK
jgi:hypothetical protein